MHTAARTLIAELRTAPTPVPEPKHPTISSNIDSATIGRDLPTQLPRHVQWRGVRYVRPLALIAGLADGTCDYLGNSRLAREYMAYTDGQATSYVIRQSSFGKLYLNNNSGMVLTIQVPITAAQLNVNQATECSSSEAYNRLGEMMKNNLPSGIDLNNFNAIIHYYPEQLITGYCAVGGWSYDRTSLTTQAARRLVNGLA